MTTMTEADPLRILIVSPNISQKMGGEAVLPYHYIREIGGEEFDLHALAHARVRDEIKESAIADKATFHFVEDTAIEKTLFQIGERMPGAIRETVFNALIGVITSYRLAQTAKLLARATPFDVIHQPTPVSPMAPSFIDGDIAPLVIGPMNGAMTYPDGFRKEYSRGSEGFVGLARFVGELANKVFRGKAKAAKILVANARTAGGLPQNVDRANVETLVENGIDLALWTSEKTSKSPAHFVFVGRLVWWKAVDLAIEAFAKLDRPATLTIIGDGPERAALETLCTTLLQDKGPLTVNFTGFLPQNEIRDHLAQSSALVLPSVRECGGAVVLEAFACRTPAIATDWGGPQDYITEETGILVAPQNREQFIDDLCAAMTSLIDRPDRVEAMGNAARERIESHFTWKAKATRMREIYQQLAK